MPSQPRPTTVGALLVTYQSAAHLPGCVASLGPAADPHEVEVVVVDNASRDGSAALAGSLGATVVANQVNRGFGDGVNAAARQTTAPWLLVVNPDTRLAPGSLARLLDTAAGDPAIGCAGPRLREADGSDYPTGRRFPSVLVGGLHAVLAPLWPGNPATRRYHLAEVDREAGPVTVDWVSGACMLVRRDAFDAVGGFDPRYFMYFEDMDLCLRLARAGWRVVLEPRAEVRHAGGASSATAPYRKVFRHHRSALRFYRRRYARDPRVVLAPLVAAGLVARGLVSLLRAWLRTRQQRGTAARHDLVRSRPDRP